MVKEALIGWRISFVEKEKDLEVNSIVHILDCLASENCITFKEEALDV